MLQVEKDAIAFLDRYKALFNTDGWMLVPDYERQFSDDMDHRIRWFGFFPRNGHRFECCPITWIEYRENGHKRAPSLPYESHEVAKASKGLDGLSGPVFAEIVAAADNSTDSLVRRKLLDLVGLKEHDAWLRSGKSVAEWNRDKEMV